MCTPRLSMILCTQSIRSRSRVVLSPRLLWWLKETLHRGRPLALLVVLSIMVVPVVACAPPSAVPPFEPPTAQAVGPSPNPVLRVLAGQWTTPKLTKHPAVDWPAIWKHQFEEGREC
jgi:hypothetical protein